MRAPKTWSLMPKGCQNGTKLDTRTHDKSMPKLVKTKIMKIIQIKFLSIVKSSKPFLRFSRLHARTEKVSEEH